MSEQKASTLYRAWRLYVDGFRGLTHTSRILWLIIAIKLIVMFAVLRPFFFPNYTKRQAAALEISGSEWVQQDLIERGAQSDKRVIDTSVEVHEETTTR